MIIMSGLALRIVAMAVFAAASVAPASATVLFDNVATVQGSTNMSRASVASEFTLDAPVTISEIRFISVSRFGGVLTEVQWALYDGNPFFGGTRLGGATDTPTGFFLAPGPASQRYVNILSVSPGVSLNAGTYWLEIGNGVMSDATRAILELGSNPAESWANDDFFGPQLTADNGSGGGSINFQLIGSVVPEPASWAMMIAGFGLVGLTARRRRTVGVLA